MTALENVVEGAYPSDVTPIVDKTVFKRLERRIKGLIDAESLPSALKAKTQELNRLSFAEKLSRYLEEHAIVVADIPAADRAAIIKARNDVVHRGVYPHGLGGQVDIRHHIKVAREVLIRIFLDTLGFRGNYFSNLFRDQQLPFPSCRRLADANGFEIAADDPAGEPQAAVMLPATSGTAGRHDKP